MPILPLDFSTLRLLDFYTLRLYASTVTDS